MYFEVVAIQLARTNPSRDKMIELSLCAWNERGEVSFAKYMEDTHLNESVRNFNYNAIGDAADGDIDPRDVQASHLRFLCECGIARWSYDGRAMFVRCSCDGRAMVVRYSCDGRAMVVRYSCDDRATTSIVLASCDRRTSVVRPPHEYRAIVVWFIVCCFCVVRRV
jgi:hypothetical protein